MVANIDDNVGRLLNWITIADWTGTTLIVLLTGQAAPTGILAVTTPACRARRARHSWAGLAPPPSGAGRALCPRGCTALTGAANVFPTVVDLAGFLVPNASKPGGGTESRSLLEKSQGTLAGSHPVHHVGRWTLGEPADATYRAVRCGPLASRIAGWRRTPHWMLF